MNEMKRMTDTQRWHAVMTRDARFDREFVYGVTSTGIYCRASCPSRRPGRPRVVFFEGPGPAEREGFRPCRRCGPGHAGPGGTLVERVKMICRHIDENPQMNITLRDLAALAGLSPFHLQRSFKRATGVTPRQYADERRMGRLKRHLREGRNVTDALYEAGFGSSSRLYERSSAGLGMTPGAYRRGGPSADIRYTIARSPLGPLLVAATARGICRVMLGGTKSGLESDLRREYPEARPRRDDAPLRLWVDEILRGPQGRRPDIDLPLDIQATAFQRRVWEMLRSIPIGATRSYSEIARSIGKPGAARAVGAACAANPVALVIPCHRVVRSDGGLGGYAWGVERKKALLEKEAGRRRKRGTREIPRAR